MKIEKKENCLYLQDDSILYIEKTLTTQPKNQKNQKKPVRSNSVKFSKTAGHKINIEKSVALLYTTKDLQKTKNNPIYSCIKINI